MSSSMMDLAPLSVNNPHRMFTICTVNEVPRPFKRGFWPARRPEAMRTEVREPLGNAAGQVPPHTKRVLVRKALGGDAY